ncbi:MAG: 50S ribosomal protein L6 [Chlamydiales bacterium]
MSRKAKYPIQLPKGVEIKFNENEVNVKGPNGNLTQPLKSCIDVKTEGDRVQVLLKDEHSEDKQFLGLYHSLIKNMVHGVTEGFNKVLEMIGVGYRATVKENLLDLQLGFSHPTQIEIPEGITVKVEKNTVITVSGAQKQKVGEFAASIRRLRPPEPYQGKGIRYKDEYVRRKPGKSAAKK